MDILSIIGFIAFLSAIASIVVGKDTFRRLVNVIAAISLAAIVFVPDSELTIRASAIGALLASFLLDIAYTSTTGRR